jgi:hypothetical protein
MREREYCSYCKTDITHRHCECMIPVKPPIGIMPKYIWDSKRKEELSEAINRFTSAGSQIPIEWIEEYNELNKLK